MKRSKQTLSHYRMHTLNMGDCVPIGCVPVLPGDTVQHHTQAMIRVSPMNTPVMHPVQVRIHHFYVPNRLVWSDWEDFITGGEDGMKTPEIPTIDTAENNNWIPGYLGVPPIAGSKFNALPLYGFNKIWNEYYRDQDLQPERALTQVDKPKCSWEKDYFTTARPWTQKGPNVSLPLGTQAPIKGIGKITANFPESGKNYTETGGNARVYPNSQSISAATGDSEFGVLGTGASGSPEIYADLTQAGLLDINDLRRGFAIQRYQEARARYGSRFTEYLRYCGITPSDARLQRPEYLGGGTGRMNFSEVLQTAPSQVTQTGETPFQDQLGVGDMYGHGIAGVRTNRYRRFFEEHGYIITVMSVRPKATYLNGINREFIKRTKEDYFQKELQHIGQQEVFNNEVSIRAGGDTSVFGYQDRYSEYRYHPSYVGEQFRNVLNAWHLGRDIPNTAALNASFVECDPSRRIFQVTDDQYDTLWAMINHHMVARRMVSKRATNKVL